MIRLIKKQKIKDYYQKHLGDVTTYCNVRLRKLASYLSKKTQRIPEQKLARTLISIFLIITLALTCKLFYLFRQRMQIEFPSIRAPVSKPFYQPSVNDIVLHRIRKFHLYLDSVKRNNRHFYDSIMQTRPHLVDSIIAIEGITNQQNSKP